MKLIKINELDIKNAVLHVIHRHKIKDEEIHGFNLVEDIGIEPTTF